MRRVFVYGSLRRGAERNDLLATSTFIGKASTTQPFRMLDGPYPVLRDNAPDGHPVAGEVYEVDERALAALDDYEGVGEQLYERTEIEVAVAGDVAATLAFAYIGCSAHWDSQSHQLYQTLDENGHLDWRAKAARISPG